MNASEIHCCRSLLLRLRLMLTRQNHYLPSKIIATTSNHHHHHQLVSVIHVPMVLLSSLGQNGSFWLLLLPASCHTSESTATANGQTVGVWRSGELLWPHAGLTRITGTRSHTAFGKHCGLQFLRSTRARTPWLKRNLPNEGDLTAGNLHVFRKS